jgi:hypothetical protein
MEPEQLKETILNSAATAAAKFVYYDRKEDEELPRGAIEQAIVDGVITEDEIVEAFRTEAFGA